MRRPPLILVPTAGEARRLFPADTLLDGPARTVQLDSTVCHVALCGLGPVAAAAATMQAILAHKPGRALLVGIAGSYDLERRGIGETVIATRIRLHGVGAGEGARFAALPYPQLPAGYLGEDVHTVLDLEDSPQLREGGACADTERAEVLTVCAAAADPQEAAERHRRYPDSVAEEMEGFAVALACRMAGVPLTILRGISNLAGDRDPRGWESQGALDACRGVLSEWLRGV